MSPERVSVVEEGEGHSMEMDRKQKRRGNQPTKDRESGARNLEAESIRSRADSTGGCVKLKTVTDIRRSSARDTFFQALDKKTTAKQTKTNKKLFRFSSHFSSFLTV